jgi:hypothetical protein
MVRAVAIREAVKDKAFRLIRLGYTQSRKSIECSICGCKYLLLLTDQASPRDVAIGNDAQEKALRYFARRIRESHQVGHRHRLLMREESVPKHELSRQ